METSKKKENEKKKKIDKKMKRKKLRRRKGTGLIKPHGSVKALSITPR